MCTFLIFKRLSEQPTQAAFSHTIHVCQQLVAETWKAAEGKLFQLPLVCIYSASCSSAGPDGMTTLCCAALLTPRAHHVEVVPAVL
jgi:hypothetical protein